MTSLTTNEAAPLIGVSRDEVGWLAKTGRLPARRKGRYWLVDAADVGRFVARRDRWISMTEAARLTGFGRSRVVRAVRGGEIEQRSGVGSPSLDRESVQRWAERTVREDSRRAIVRAHKARERADAEAARRALLESAEWLDGATAASALGISHTRVSQLARADRIPHIQRGRFRYFRRADIERLAAARRFRAEMEQARMGRLATSNGGVT